MEQNHTASQFQFNELQVNDWFLRDKRRLPCQVLESGSRTAGDIQAESAATSTFVPRADRPSTDPQEFSTEVSL